MLEHVSQKFPDAGISAVGGLVFLRFICPIVVSPDGSGLCDAPSKELRRGLVFIAKIIQNLANNVQFGGKEAYMTVMNDFVTDRLPHVNGFLKAISVRRGFSTRCLHRSVKRCVYKCNTP